VSYPQKQKTEMKHSEELIDKIIEYGAISDTNLRMLVDEIQITEKDKKLNITITLKSEFGRYFDFYD